MKILNETKNDLLKRKELSFIMESESNPGLNGTKQAIVEKFKVSEEFFTLNQFHSLIYPKAMLFVDNNQP